MKRVLLYFILLAVLVAVPAFAENNSVLNVHVNKAVAIPGNVLAPGDYVFRIVNVESGSPVVAVTSADFRTTYGYINVYTSYRNAASTSEVRSVASEDSDLKRIESWYFPGEKSGYRFIYSKSDLVKIAAAGRKRSMGEVAGQ